MNHIIQKLRRSKVSTTAREVMYDLLYQASPKKPHVLINVQALAESVVRKESSIKRAVRELVNAGFLVEGMVVSLKHKVYKVAFDIIEAVKEAAKSVAKSVQKVAEKVVEIVRPKPIPKETPNYDNIGVVPEKADQIRELSKTLAGFGFTKKEQCDIVYFNEVEGSQRLILAYLETMKRGDCVTPREWFFPKEEAQL